MTAGKTLREHAGEYLAMRRALGFSLTTFGIRLGSFITWLESTGATVITSDAAIAWAAATRRGSADPAYLARRLDVARIFARHMQVLDPATEVPPMDVLSRRYRRITPHLYPPAEIAAILSRRRESCRRRCGRRPGRRSWRCWPPPACGYRKPAGSTAATPASTPACSPSATPSSASPATSPFTRLR